MSEKLKSIVSFFRTRQISAKIRPKIQVDYEKWDYNDSVALALKNEWEALRKEIDANPSCIQKQEWSTWGSKMRQEKLTIEIEGVTLDLEGPHYPDPNYKSPEPEPIMSDEQRGNEAIDSSLHQTNLIWAITHCSSLKFEAFIDFVEATRKTRTRL